MPTTLADLPKGYEFPPTSFDLSPEWVASYIDAVGDRATRALGEDLVPPTAITALSVRALLDHASLPPGAIHVSQEITVARAARTGETLTARAAIASRGERQGWVLMGVDLRVEAAGHAPVVTGRATITFPLDGDA